MPTPNPVLQQIIKGISSKANSGRIDLSWGSLNEARKRGKVREATPPQPDDEEVPEKEPALPEMSAGDKGEPKQSVQKDKKPTMPVSPQNEPKDDSSPSPEQPAPDAAPEDVEKAQGDAEKANAELEKAKSEKDQAEQEIEQNAYVKLNTPGGVSFLLNKLVDHAVKTNTLDALAGDFVQKLKITTPEDFKTFSDDMIPYKNIPGMVEFISAIQSLASQKQPPAED